MNTFHYPAMRELTDQQVRFAPAVRRQEQLTRAEKLLAEIDAAKIYPYQFVCFRITDFRSDAHPDLRMAGANLAGDLALFVKKVERSLPPLPIELAAEPMLTLEEVSKQFNVSTKTVSRWRLLGLTARRVLRGGRKHLGFPKSSVEAFAQAHRVQVERGSRFSHLTDSEKDNILLTARTMAMTGGSLTEVSKKLAQQFGRSAEAVRYTIKNFDRAHPDSAVFPQLGAPLNTDSKTKIFNDYQEGKPVDLIAKRFGRTRSSMYRVINEVRAEQLIRTPVDYIYNPEFDDPIMEPIMLAPIPDHEDFEDKLRTMRAPKDVDPNMGVLVRAAAAQQSPGSAPVPQDELPEAQAPQVQRRPRSDPRAGERSAEDRNPHGRDQGLPRSCSSSATCAWCTTRPPSTCRSARTWTS